MVGKITKNQELSNLIDQSLALLNQIQKHPDFQALEYHPDVTLGDAQQALIELHWETLPPDQPIKIFSLESFISWKSAIASDTVLRIITWI